MARLRLAAVAEEIRRGDPAAHGRHWTARATTCSRSTSPIPTCRCCPPWRRSARMRSRERRARGPGRARSSWARGSASGRRRRGAAAADDDGGPEVQVTALHGRAAARRGARGREEGKQVHRPRGRGRRRGLRVEDDGEGGTPRGIYAKVYAPTPVEPAWSPCMRRAAG